MRYVVLSDMHFGMSESSVNDRQLLEALASHLSQAPADAVVFSGDLLDLNLSTFVRSIEGSNSRNLIGFREFLTILHNGGVSAGEWIYIPGNHDYKIWDVLAVNKNVVDTLSAGRSMRTVSLPIYNGCWKHGSAFVAGVFPPELRASVTVEYPDHVVQTGDGELVVTHGHYFDPKQTLMKQLRSLMDEDGMSEDEAVRTLFIETAAYQTLAGCASFTDWSRTWVNRLVGPSSLVDEAKELADRVAAWLGSDRRDLFVSPLRGKAIEPGQLAAMEVYLRHFQHRPTPPRYVVYGHTHHQDHATTAKVPRPDRIYQETIEVYNVGSFYADGGTLATFLEIDVPSEGPPSFRPMYIDAARNIRVRQLS